MNENFELMEQLQSKNDKLSLWGKMKNSSLKIASIFRRFPITMACILLIAIGFSIIIDCPSEWNTALENFLVFTALVSYHSLFFEEKLSDNQYIKYIGIVVSGIFSFIIVTILNIQSEYLFHMKRDYFIDYLIRFIVCEASFLVIFSIYHMYKQKETEFEEYCMDTFCAVVKTSVVYYLFAIGMAIIVFIFDVLIFDTGSFLPRLEIVLVGVIYSPAILLSFSDKKDSAGKFAPNVILYILQPMLMISFLIIYIYIFKSFFSGGLPKNQLFNIVSFLFATGLPIWTTASSCKEQPFHRVSEYLPYVFLPFLILQVLCIGIRVNNYGLTLSRYNACMLVLFEMIYFIFYSVQMFYKKKVISKILYVIPVLAFVILLAPGINLESAVVRSQMKRLDSMLSTVQKGDEESLGYSIYSSYSQIRNSGYIGNKKLEEKYNEEELEYLSSLSWERNYSNYIDFEYYNAGDRLNNLDITKYKSITEVYGEKDYSNDNQYANADSGHILLSFYTANDRDLFITSDIREICFSIISMESCGEDYELHSNNIYVLDQQYDLFITSIYLKYIQNTKEISSIDIDGFLLEK